MLNVRKFTLNREQTTQTFLIDSDDRLDGLLDGPISLDVSLKGDMQDNKPIIVGTVSGTLTARCQVCNEAVSWHHDFDFSVYPVEETKLDTLDDTMDPILIEDGKLNIEDMLVNELILSQPTVITHLTTTGYDCSEHMSMSIGEKLPKKASPFAVLEQLKSPGKGD